MKLDEVDPALRKMLEDREWRLNNLYWIEDKKGRLTRFRMNYAQKYLFDHFHHRNEILKARQLGISTFVAILMLDCCLFTAHWSCGVVDKTKDDAKKKLGKALLAYDFLDYEPKDASEYDRALAAIGREIKAATPLWKRGETKATWKNYSSIEVGASMRGGTLQMLHVSELAYVANHNPIRAKEIQTGALNTVEAENYIIKESTHEGGRAGINYAMVQQAIANQSKAELSQMDYRFFFFSWWQNPQYELDSKYWEYQPDPRDKVAWKERKNLEEYFEHLEKLGIKLSDEKKAWYQSQSRILGFMVRQEYPSYPDEAFDVKAERSIYMTELTLLKMAERMLVEFDTDPMRPTYVSWDIGRSDAMSIWLWQIESDGTYLVVDHYSASRMTLDHFVGIVRGWEGKYRVSVSRHILPHDARNTKWDGDCFERALQRAGFSTTVVPRTPDVWVGIQATRLLLPRCVFHARCGDEVVAADGRNYPSGVQCLENYQTAPDGSNGVERSMPLHDRHCHSADAFRMFAEALQAGLINAQSCWREIPRQNSNVAVGAEWLY